MLVACRLAGQSALEAHYPGRPFLTSSSATAALRDPNDKRPNRPFAALAQKRPGLSGPSPRRMKVSAHRFPVLASIAPYGAADLRDHDGIRERRLEWPSNLHTDWQIQLD
jgi:hypothetical protein